MCSLASVAVISFPTSVRRRKKIEEWRRKQSFAFTRSLGREPTITQATGSRTQPSKATGHEGLKERKKVFKPGRSPR